MTPRAETPRAEPGPPRVTASIRGLGQLAVRTLVRVAAVSAWVAIPVLSLVPGSERPHTGYSGNVEHAAAYTLAALAMGLGFSALRGLGGVALFAGSAALFELAQTAIPGRHAGIDNWAASSAGAVLGLGLAALASRLRRAASG